MTVNVLIVDDEPLARSRLERLLGQLEGYTVVAQAENGQQAIEYYQQYRPDLILMDIRMPVMDGLCAARALDKLEQPPAIIFCTAYSDYAIEAFDVNAVGYLLKPVNQDKLAQALAKAGSLNKAQLSALNDVAQSNERSHISAKTHAGIELIPLDEVRYFFAEQKYVSAFYHQQGVATETLIDESLKELEEAFGERFFRVHRNALVSVAHVQGLQQTAEGYRVVLAGVEQGPLVSRRHLPAVRKRLQQL